MNTLLLAALIAPSASAVPTSLTHQGRMFDALGAPLDGSHDVDILLYDTPAGGTAIWSEAQTTTFEQGYYTLVLGSNPSNALDIATIDVSELYLTTAIDSGPESDRMAVHSVPYAMLAGAIDGDLPWSQLSGVPSGLDDGDDDTITTSLDWTAITNRPAGLDDGDDDTVTASLDWTSINNRPSGLDDGDDDTTTPQWADIQSRPAGLDDGDDVGLDTAAVEALINQRLCEYRNGAWDASGGTCTEPIKLSDSAIAPTSINWAYDGGTCGAGYHVCMGTEYFEYIAIIRRMGCPAGQGFNGGWPVTEPEDRNQMFHGHSNSGVSGYQRGPMKPTGGTLIQTQGSNGTGCALSPGGGTSRVWCCVNRNGNF